MSLRSRQTVLAESQRCSVRLPGGKLAWGYITRLFEKRCEVLLDGASEPETFSRKKVSPAGPVPKSLRPTAQTNVIPPSLSATKLPLYEQEMLSLTFRPQPKPAAPESCPEFLAFVRRHPCCHCGNASGAPTEPHHEGKKGIAQKVRDTLAVPLCAYCHFIYTATNCLPALPLDPSAASPPLLSREDSLRILRAAQFEIINAVFARMEPRMRIDVLSTSVAQLEPGILARLLDNPAVS